jgi:hypothetical protein
MKLTALHIERWLDGVEARIVPPERRGLRVIIHEGDDEAAAMEKAVAEHIAAHPEDAGFTVASIAAALNAAGRRWMVREIVHSRQVPLKDEDAVRRLKDERDAVRDIEDAVVPEMSDLPASPDVSSAPAPNVLSIDLARSKPWRPVHQRPARDMRRPTWKKWER